MERVYTSSPSTRNPRWRYPHGAPTPRILHLPRRPIARRKSSTKTQQHRDSTVKLEILFDQERSFHGGQNNGHVSILGEEEEKWRFQAEMLRAECNLLRMEREIAVKKMERRKKHMERILRSVVHTLRSGRQRISEGQNLSKILEEEINYLVQKLNELRINPKAKVSETRNCSNFDRQASVLRRRLERFQGMSEEMRVKEIREMAEASLSITPSCHTEDSHVSSSNSNMGILRRKMEALSKGVLLETMEGEYSPTLRAKSCDEKACSGRCRAVVRRIVEQVRAETEQWSQMQEMLGQVREEMEELQASRNFWEELALGSESQIQSLGCTVQEWRQRALCSEARANELQVEGILLQEEIERLKRELSEKSPPRISGEQGETDKRVLICSLKANKQDGRDRLRHRKLLSEETRKVQTTSSDGLAVPKLPPLREIGNLSPAIRKCIKPDSPFWHHDKENKF